MKKTHSLLLIIFLLVFNLTSICMFSNDNPGYTLDTYPPPLEAGVTTNGGWEVTTMDTSDPGLPSGGDPGAALPINDWIYAILVITTAGMLLYFRKHIKQKKHFIR